MSRKVGITVSLTPQQVEWIEAQDDESMSETVRKAIEAYKERSV